MHTDNMSIVYLNHCDPDKTCGEEDIGDLCSEQVKLVTGTSNVFNTHEKFLGPKNKCKNMVNQTISCHLI